jgi:hypothetical protein
MMEVLFLHLAGEFLLAGDRQDEIIDVDVDILPRHVGKLRLEDHFVVAVLIDIDRRQPGIPGGKTEIAKRIPSHDCHDVFSLSLSRFRVFSVYDFSILHVGT